MDAMAWRKGTPMAGGGPGGEEPAAPRSAATGGRDLPGDRRLRTGGAVGEGGLQLDELGFMVGLWWVYGGFIIDGSLVNGIHEPSGGNHPAGMGFWVFFLSASLSHGTLSHGTNKHCLI